jgi:hypothetical protein
MIVSYEEILRQTYNRPAKEIEIVDYRFTISAAGNPLAIIYVKLVTGDVDCIRMTKKNGEWHMVDYAYDALIDEKMLNHPSLRLLFLVH